MQFSHYGYYSQPLGKYTWAVTFCSLAFNAVVEPWFWKKTEGMQ